MVGAEAAGGVATTGGVVGREAGAASVDGPGGPSMSYISGVTRRTRFMITLTMFVGTLMVFAPMAMARDDGGEGWWGESTDSQVTSVMFIVIAFFPTLILVLTLIQWRLDKRKHAREDAAKAREQSADWRGGW